MRIGQGPASLATLSFFLFCHDMCLHVLLALRLRFLVISVHNISAFHFACSWVMSQYHSWPVNAVCDVGARVVRVCCFCAPGAPQDFVLGHNQLARTALLSAQNICLMRIRQGPTSLATLSFFLLCHDMCLHVPLALRLRFLVISVHNISAFHVACSWVMSQYY
jgi:hypothetical protein